MKQDLQKESEKKKMKITELSLNNISNLGAGFEAPSRTTHPDSGGKSPHKNKLLLNEET